MKDISRIIKEFKKLPYKRYVCKIHKHEPTDIYFYLEKQIFKFMMRADYFNFYVDPIRTEINVTQQIPISHGCDSDKSESK